MKRLSRLLTTAAAALALAACGSPKDATERNFAKALEAYLATQKACIRLPAESFPASVQIEDSPLRSGRASTLERLDALVQAGALESTDVTEVRKQLFGQERDVAVRRYNLTPAGEKALLAEGSRRPQLCYGRPELSAVVRFTDPSEMMGMKISQVVYTTKLIDVADFAKDENVQQIWPQIAESLDASKHHDDVLILTNEGWIHEKLMTR